MTLPKTQRLNHQHQTRDPLGRAGSLRIITSCLINS